MSEELQVGLTYQCNQDPSSSCSDRNPQDQERRQVDQVAWASVFIVLFTHLTNILGAPLSKYLTRSWGFSSCVIYIYERAEISMEHLIMQLVIWLRAEINVIKKYRELWQQTLWDLMSSGEGGKALLRKWHFSWDSKDSNKSYWWLGVRKAARGRKIGR